MINKKQKQFIQIALANPQMNDGEIATELGISYVTASRGKNNSEFEEAYNAALKEQGKGFASEAQAIMHNSLYSDRADVALNAAKYILDSNGFKPTDNVKVEADINTIRVTIDEE